jgi:hypothetical protein
MKTLNQRRQYVSIRRRYIDGLLLPAGERIKPRSVALDIPLFIILLKQGGTLCTK